MTRTLVVMLSAVLAACDVGSVLVNHGGPDGGSNTDSGGGKMDAGGNGCVALAPNGDDGHHNAGMACIASGCHLAAAPGAGATPWAYAGTLYKSDGVTPVVGATIIISNGAGTPMTATTGANGNFHFAAPPTIPPSANTKTSVSGCPDVKAMNGAITPGNGNCNNCHRPGGTTTTIKLNVP